jgi:SpoOM protein
MGATFPSSIESDTMSFIDTVKNWLGLGGVKVELTVPGQVEKAAGKVSGKIVLTTKSDKLVKTIQVRCEELWSTGKGDDKQSKTLILGQIDLSGNFEMKTGEVKTLEFEVPFSIVKSKNDELKDKGGVLGGLGKMGSFLDSEKSSYSVVVDVDVDKVALDPSDRKDIRLM